MILKKTTATTVHNVWHGMNAQAWAALSIFLQCLNDVNFSYIHLEEPGFNDFNLYFSDGHKIICEVKNRKAAFSYPDLINVLDPLLVKGNIEKNDEILIICKTISSRFQNIINNARYFKVAQEYLKNKKRFSDQHINLLEKIKFWKVDKEINRKICLALFAEFIGFWLPDENIEEWISSIIMGNIYEVSAKGEVFTKEQILARIERKRWQIESNSGFLNNTDYALMKKYEDHLDNPTSHMWANNQLAVLSIRPNLVFRILNILSDQDVKDLSSWSHVWEVCKISHFHFILFKIFEKNLGSHQNRRYILNFLADSITEIKRFYRLDYFEHRIIELLTKILDKNTSFIESIFNIIEKLLNQRDDIFYAKIDNDFDSHAFWEREETAKLLSKVFAVANKTLQNKIYEFIIEKFNLVEDEGNYSHYTPKAIFGIMREWLLFNFEANLDKFKINLVEQFKRSNYLYDNGWEISGGMTSTLNYKCNIEDRHFLAYSIIPAVKKYYHSAKNSEVAWDFLEQYCITDKKLVNESNPDFMSRAMIDILLERLNSSNKITSANALEILEKYVCMRKGIPSKADLIYQAISEQKNLSNKLKWQLIKVGLKKHKYLSIFMEEIISGLVWDNCKPAKEKMKDWITTDAYYKIRSQPVRITETIKDGLYRDFGYAVELFNAFINSKFFKQDYSDFSAYAVANILSDILHIDYNLGISILIKLYNSAKLTKNQQILCTHSLLDKEQKRKAQDAEFFVKIYDDIVFPFLLKNNDITSITNKFTFSHAREAFVDFADHLAINKKIKEALSIISMFIEDVDPSTESEKIMEGKSPRIITSVRGKCAWALMNCVTYHGRSYLDKIVNFTEKLTKDENYYVKHMSCFPLSQLTRIRLSVMPEDKSTLFLDNNILNALKKAKHIESIAFGLLQTISKTDVNIKKALVNGLLKVFDNIRALNEKNAWLLLHTISSVFPIKVVAESAFLFVYFAELRKNVFKNWSWKRKNYYDDLEPSQFNDSRFKSLLEEVIKQTPVELRYKFAIQFRSLFDLNTGVKSSLEKALSVSYNNINDILSSEYDGRLFTILYDIIKFGFEKSRDYQKWYDLYLKCLTQEYTFCSSLNEENKRAARGRAYFKHADLLKCIDQKRGFDDVVPILEKLVDTPSALDFSFKEGLGEIFPAESREIWQDKLSSHLKEKLFNELDFT